MTTVRIRGNALEIRPIEPGELELVLNVYRQCEDFLALGPQPHASLSMVEQDIAHSREEGGVFCGIFDSQGKIVGVVDFVPGMYAGNPEQAFLSLLMIAFPYRARGLGAEVVRLLEAEIEKDGRVKSILSGVQINNPAAMRFWQRMGYRIVGGPEAMPDQTTVFHLRKDFPH